MPPAAPCRLPGCADPERSGGQWGFIPEAYCTEHGLTYRKDSHCKKPACLRVVGRKPPPQPPGRKRKHSLSPETVMATSYDELLPRPPTILTIQEIWADRYLLGLHCVACVCLACVADCACVRFTYVSQVCGH